MARRGLAGEYSPEPNLLEVRASAFLKKLAPQGSAGARPLQDPGVVELRSLVRRGTGLAAAAGVVSGALIGGLEIFVRREMMGGEAGMDWLEQAPYWAVFFAVAGLISAVEIAFLYWNGLRSVGRISRLAEVGLEASRYGDLVARGLARASLEFPNPGTRVFGVDPYAYVAKWQLTLKNLLYKTKVGVSSFVLRLALRRVVGRMTLRGIIPLVAAPLYALWNAIITWRLLSEARLRALAPGAIEARVRRVETMGGDLSPLAIRAAVEGAGELMMRAKDAHPNYVYLLARLLEAFNMENEQIVVDWERARSHLRALEVGEREEVIDVLILASLLAGKVNDEQKEFLREICADAGRTLNANALASLGRRLMEGRPITTDDLRAART